MVLLELLELQEVLVQQELVEQLAQVGLVALQEALDQQVHQVQQELVALVDLVAHQVLMEHLVQVGVLEQVVHQELLVLVDQVLHQAPLVQAEPQVHQVPQQLLDLQAQLVVADLQVPLVHQVQLVQVEAQELVQ